MAVGVEPDWVAVDEAGEALVVLFVGDANTGLSGLLVTDAEDADSDAEPDAEPVAGAEGETDELTEALVNAATGDLSVPSHIV